MNPLQRLRRRLSTRIAVFVAVLLFSATAVEVAPKAIDVLQDLGWLPPDAAEGPAEAAALPQPDETLVHSSAIKPVTTVDDASFDRLAQFAASQAGAFEEPIVQTSAVSATDQTDVVALLEGVIDLDEVPGAEFATAPLPAYRSSVPSSAGLSAPAVGPLAAMTPTETGTQPDLSVLAGAPSADGELASITSEGTTTGVVGEGKTANATSGGTTTSIGQTDGPATTHAAAAVEPTSAEEGDSAAGYALATAPRTESGTGANTSQEVSPVAVPEPATLLLLGGGLLGLAHFGRRKVAR